MSQHADPWAEIIEWRRSDGLAAQHHLGVTHDAWVWSNAQTQTLTVGASRSIAGKTAGVLIPVTLSIPGPAVVVTTKFDVAQATAVCRARLGPLWHFGVDGEPILPGFQSLRWSPIQASGTWDGAQGAARQLIELSDVGQAAKGQANTSDVGHHFGSQAGSLLACLLYFAASHGRPMDWIVDFVGAQIPDEMKTLLPLMYALSERAGRQFEGLTWADPRTRGSTYDTARVALQAYQLESALDSARWPNFDPDQFVSGTSTIYITAGRTNQASTAGIICCFLSQVRDATYKRHDMARKVGRSVMPTTMVLDELANIAPWPDLPSVLSEGGSQGLIVVGALQDLSQAKQRWGDAIGSGFLTLWNNVIILPGIRDKETLETLSMLCGDWDRPVWSESYPETQDIRQAHPSRTLNFNRQRRLSPDEISNGHPQSSDIALALIHGSGPAYLYVTPYHRTAPWTHCLVRSVQHIVKNQPELAMLPLPELDREGRGVYGRLARMGLWLDWSLAVPRYLDQRAQIAPPSVEHDDLLIWITEKSSDVLWEILVTEFEHDGVIVFPEPAPIVLPGEDWRRSAMIIRDGPTDHLFVIDAHSLWKEEDEAKRERVITTLGAEPGQSLWVHYRLHSQDVLQRLYAALAVHCSVYSERPNSNAVGSDRTD
jgi:type IV secretory pathway TraG/TraD family ATPase VirD4